MSTKFWKFLLGIIIFILIGAIIFIFFNNPMPNIFGKWRPSTWKQTNDNDNIYFTANVNSPVKPDAQGKIPYKCNVLKSYGVNKPGENTLFVVCKDPNHKIRDLVYKIPQYIDDGSEAGKYIIPDDLEGVKNYHLDGTIQPTKTASCTLLADSKNLHYKIASDGSYLPTMMCNRKKLSDKPPSQTAYASYGNIYLNPDIYNVDDPQCIVLNKGTKLTDFTSVGGNTPAPSIGTYGALRNYSGNSNVFYENCGTESDDFGDPESLTDSYGPFGYYKVSTGGSCTFGNPLINTSNLNTNDGGVIIACKPKYNVTDGKFVDLDPKNIYYSGISSLTNGADGNYHIVDGDSKNFTTHVMSEQAMAGLTGNTDSAGVPTNKGYSPSATIDQDELIKEFDNDNLKLSKALKDITIAADWGISTKDVYTYNNTQYLLDPKYTFYAGNFENPYYANWGIDPIDFSKADAHATFGTGADGITDCSDIKNRNNSTCWKPPYPNLALANATDIIPVFTRNKNTLIGGTTDHPNWAYSDNEGNPVGTEYVFIGGNNSLPKISPVPGTWKDKKGQPTKYKWIVYNSLVNNMHQGGNQDGKGAKPKDKKGTVSWNKWIPKDINFNSGDLKNPTRIKPGDNQARNNENIVQVSFLANLPP